MYKALYFAAGATIGSLVTFFAVKKHYQKKAEEQIAAIREFHASRDESVKELEAEQQEKEKQQYTELITNLNYIPAAEPVSRPLNPAGRIEVINEEDYGNDAGYEAIPTYVYYANGILVDELGDEVSQSTIENYIGSDFYQKFGNDDVLYIRNHESKCDFEIVLDETEYEAPSAKG